MLAKIVLEIVWITFTACYAANAQMTVQASSEGTDCRCKCILTTQDGGPCEGQSGARKTVYFMETISGESDCRCACNAPPPSGCQATPQGRKVFQPDIDDLEQIDLVELHGSISNMVSAMIKLEKVIAKTRSKSQLDVVRENVNKVVSNLESTNGSYGDEVNGLILNKQTERVNASVNVSLSTTSIVPAVPPLQRLNDTTQSETTGRRDDYQRNVTQYDRIGVVPMIHATASSLATEQTTQRSERITSTTPSNEEESDTTFPSVLDIRVPGKPSIAETTTNVTKRTPVVTSTTTLPPVKPRMVFVPYRSLKKPIHHEREKSRHREAEYDYNEFDLDVVTKQTTTTTRRTGPTFTTTRPQTSPLPTANTTSSSTTTTESDESYADHLSEYEYDYDDYDEEGVETKSTTTATTTTRTTTRHIDPCGTLSSISRPIVRSHFGRREGAWMRDPVPSKTDPARSRKVYIANFYYGSSLIEFDGVEGVRRLRYRNLYNLPHKWSGTGHIVYNGSFYYNRAFSTTLIKYNLRYRFVSAWTHLANVVYNTRSPLTWKGHTGVHLAADEGGLWAIFPSQDPLDPHAKGTFIVNKINPVDLRVLESYKTKIRHPVSHAFMICGILYTTDRHNSRRARVNNAFDTRTLSQRNSYLNFENMFSYAVQFSYNPNEKKIYAWDNGRQVEYRVGLIH